MATKSAPVQSTRERLHYAASLLLDSCSRSSSRYASLHKALIAVLQDEDLAPEDDGADAAQAAPAPRQPFEAMQLLQNARVCHVVLLPELAACPSPSVMHLSCECTDTPGLIA